jgi:hypothetical protein
LTSTRPVSGWMVIVKAFVRVLDLLDLDVRELGVALREEVDAGLALGDRLGVVGGLDADDLDLLGQLERLLELGEAVVVVEGAEDRRLAARDLLGATAYMSSGLRSGGARGRRRLARLGPPGCAGARALAAGGGAPAAPIPGSPRYGPPRGP